MKKHVLIAAVAVLMSASALADGRSAAKNLFANLAVGKQDLGVKVSDVFVAPTLVRGMYALSTAQGRFVGFTNEAGTVFGDSRGFSGLLQRGAGFRPLTRDEAADLRREIAANIDKSKLITVRYGEGDFKAFMFSAIDCPHCKSLEDKLRGAKSENSTFYVIPSSLQEGNTRQGGQQWLKVASIWCATDSERAWRTYWATGAVPSAGACPFADPKIAERAQEHLWGMLKGVGVALKGTPAYVRMDGIQLKKDTLDKPLEAAKPGYWLTGATATATDFRPQPVGR